MPNHNLNILFVNVGYIIYLVELNWGIYALAWVIQLKIILKS